ncbi:MAG: translocation/assembly module TamB [Bacteroidales bacterium]|nr:translocation/assembly module TamB [Bacteroidales bacterium]
MQNHVFQIEKLKKITLYGVLLIIVLIILLILLLQTAYIQTKITKFITKELSEKLNSEIDIDNVEISLFKGFIFKGIYIQDQQKDTLLFIKELSVIPEGLQTDFSNISLKEINIDSLYLNLYEIGKDTLNLQYILDALSSDEKEKTDEDFKLDIKNISITNSSFSYFIPDTVKKHGFNYKDLELDSINIKLKKLELNNKNIYSEIESILLKDKSGFCLKNFTGDKIELSPKHIHFNNLSLQTPDSKLSFDSLYFDFPGNYDFSEYKTKLKANIIINKSSYLSYNDVKYFITDTNTYSEKVQISGKIKGTFDKFDITDLDLKYEGLIDLKMNSRVSDFKDFDNPLLFVHIKKLEVDFQRFQEMKIPGQDIILKDLPEGLKKIKNISYSGVTKGHLSKFLTKGEISGGFGSISILALAKKDSSSIINVKGKLSGTDLDIAQVFENNDFGTMSFSQNFDFSLLKNKKIKLKTSGKINDVFYKKHSYKDIALFAELYDKKVDSLSVNIKQENIRASISGKINFLSDIPEINLTANVYSADLKALNLSNAETESTVSFSTVADFKGLNIDDFLGTINLTSPFVYSKDSVTVRINAFRLTGQQTPNIQANEKQIVLKSDIADFKIITTNKSSEIFKALQTLVSGLFKQNQTDTEAKPIIKGSVVIEADIKNPEFISSLFFPKYHISKNTKLFGFYDPEKESLNLSLNSQQLKYKNFILNDFFIVAYTRNKRLFGGIGGSSLKPNESIIIENINLEGDLINDTINFNLNWNNFKDTANYSANIAGIIEIIKKDKKKTVYNCDFHKSNISINDVLWSFDKSNVLIDSVRIKITDLTLKNKDQKIYLDGNISEYPGDILFAEFTNFNLSNIQPALSEDFIIKGKLNGSTTLAQLYEAPLIFTKDSIINFNVNNIDFGNFYFKSNWDDAENKIHANAYNLKGKNNKFMNDTIYGDYWPDKDKINFTLDIRSMLLKTFKDYYSDYAEFNPTAFITGKINIAGNIKNPLLLGNLKLKQTTAKVKFLNTYYSINEMDILINNKTIRFDATKIYSRNKNGFGFLKADISHNNFSNFDLDIDIDAENLKLIALKRTDSSYFYGTAFGTGNINFSGSLDNIFMNANLSTEENTSVFIPIATSETLEEEKNFIQFVSDTSETKNQTTNENYEVDYSGFSMNMKLDVTDNAEIQIIPDESGNIKTTGDGSLNLTLDREGNFNMFGTYIISDGTYLLDLKVLPKLFNIVEGSRIIWSGDPDDALVDIKATYKINKVPVNNLVPEQLEQAIEKTDVTCLIHLTGALLNPTLNLDIEINDNVSNKYVQKLNSFNEKEINEQFLALLIFKRFMGSTADNLGIDDPAPITGDLITSQFNKMLEQFSKNIEINLKYEPGKDNETDEIGFSVEGDILNNWITYKGYGGVGGNDGYREDNYIGEFEIEGKLNKKGNIKAKFYNKANDTRLNDGDYTQGFGLVFRKKFDSFFYWKRREEKDTVYPLPIIEDKN